MASYSKRKLKGGEVWDARFRIVEFGKVVNKSLNGYKTKKEAQSAVAKFMLTYEATEKPTDEMKFEELYLLYIQHIKNRLKHSSQITIGLSLETHILPYFKDYTLSKITKKDIIEWQNKISAHPKNYSYAYKKKLHGYLTAIFNYAMEFHDLPTNPASKAKNFKNFEIKSEMKFWTEEEFKKFISAVDDLLYKAFFSFLYLTGARRGEALALTWGDFKDNYVIINKACDFHIKGQRYALTSPKNQSSNRKIILPESLVNLLKELQNNWSYGSNSKINFIFGGTEPLPPETIRRKMKEYCEKSGVKEIRIHDFRHSHASLLINNSQNVLAVAKRLGHTNIEMTLNRYSHFFDKEQAKLADSINIEL